MRILFLALALLPISARADVVYSCRVLIAAADLGNAPGEWTFSSAPNPGDHGGIGQEFKQGAHVVTVAVDAQWLNVSWARAGKNVAVAQFVVGPGDQPQFKVGVLFDPGHDGDQVSVSCEKK